MRKINRIFWHCTATSEGQRVSTEAIRRDHMTPKPKGRGFLDIGYHFVIELDGSVHSGRPKERVGAGANGHNLDSIHVVYVGGLDRRGVPKDTRTEAQRAALYKLTEELLAEFPGATVHGHNEVSSKACPSFKAGQDWAAYLARKEDQPGVSPETLDL